MQYSKIVHRKTRIRFKKFLTSTYSQDTRSHLCSPIPVYLKQSRFRFFSKSTHRTFETTLDTTHSDSLIVRFVYVWKHFWKKVFDQRHSLRPVKNHLRRTFACEVFDPISNCRWQRMPGIFHNENWSLFSWSINRLGRLCGGDAAADRVVGKGQRGLCLVLVVCRSGTKRGGWKRRVVSRLVQGQT